MAESDMQYHEPPEELSTETRDLHRALRSLMEELEAIDWYQHRVDATKDPSLRAVLLHNRNEEMEHAAMMLEWLRRRLPHLDEQLRTYLFTEGPITEIEEEEEGGGGESAVPSSDINTTGLGLGQMKAPGRGKKRG